MRKISLSVVILLAGFILLSNVSFGQGQVENYLRKDLFNKVSSDIEDVKEAIEYWKKISGLKLKYPRLKTLSLRVDELLILLEEKQYLAEKLKTALNNASSEKLIDKILGEIVKNDNSIIKKLHDYDRVSTVRSSLDSIYFWLTEAQKVVKIPNNEYFFDRIIEYLTTYQMKMNEEIFGFESIISGHIVFSRPPQPQLEPQPQTRTAPGIPYFAGSAWAKKALINLAWQEIKDQFPNIEISIEETLIHLGPITPNGRFFEKAVVIVCDENCQNCKEITINIPVQKKGETNREYNKRQMELFVDKLKSALSPYFD